MTGLRTTALVSFLCPTTLCFNLANYRVVGSSSSSSLFTEYLSELDIAEMIHVQEIRVNFSSQASSVG